MRLGKHFTLAEFLVSQTAARHGLDMTPTPAIVLNLRQLVYHVLDPLRERGVKTAIQVTSGYRSPELNRRIGGSTSSQHCLGQAADIKVMGWEPVAVCRAIMAMGLPFDQLILEFDQWTHVSYARDRQRGQVLTARRIGGRVRYLQGLA